MGQFRVGQKALQEMSQMGQFRVGQKALQTTGTFLVGQNAWQDR